MATKTALFARSRGTALGTADRGLIQGNVYFVGSTVTGATDATGYGLSPDAPYATLAGALSNLPLASGDTILFLPGHAETVNAFTYTSAIVAGLRLIGLGNGSNQPTFTFTTTASASIEFITPYDSITYENIRFDLTGVDALTAPLHVTINDVTFRNCRFTLANATNQAVAAIVSSGADRLLIEDCFFLGTTDAGTTAALQLSGGDGMIIRRNTFMGAYSSGVGAISVLVDATNLLIEKNNIFNATAGSTKAITATAATTGQIVGNRMQILAGTAPITAAAMSWSSHNYYAAAIATAGTLI